MKKLVLILLITAIVVIPFIGSYIKWGGIPLGYGVFPVQKVLAAPAFNTSIFVSMGIVGLVVVNFFLFPFLYGFKGDKISKAEVTKGNYPKWFVPSLIVLLISWFFMWVDFPPTNVITNLTFVPLWWSFIVFVDALVYKRNNKISLISAYPNVMKILGVASAFCWLMFEYLNFFVMENWYYPNDKIFTNFGNIVWQLLSYTTVLPTIFVCYLFLRTFDGLKNRYKNGYRIQFSAFTRKVFLCLGIIALFFMGYYPYELFWLLWVALIPILGCTLDLQNIWTPFTPIKEKGDWSYIALIAISAFANGILWEFWNFGSEYFSSSTNPNYWRYDIPYLNNFYFFSEMPMLGYLGYLFFGIIAWLLWLLVASVFDFDSTISLKNPLEVHDSTK